MNLRLSIPVAAAFALAVVAETAAGQAEPPADAVLVDFLALDEDGRPIPGLTAADIELTEEGREQEFADFHTVGPDAGPGAPPRRFVIVVNRRGAETRRLRRARSGLRRFASDQLSESDEAMLVGIGPTVEILQQFTPGADRLRERLDDLRTSPHEVFEGPRHADGGGLWDLLGGIGSELRRVPGRKVVILMSMDESTNPQGAGASSAWTFDQQSFLNALFAFNAARATVYSIDLAGGGQNRYDPSFGAERQDDPLAWADWYTARGSRPEIDRFEGGIGALATATGGSSYRNQVGFVRVLNEIGEQNRLWYQLTWSPTDAGSADRQGRPLEVRIRGRDDLEVVMRPRFFLSRLPA
jgi:VWFA-related protein